MNFLIPWFFLNQHVMDGKPTVDGNTLFDAYVDDVADNGKDVLWSCRCRRPVFIVIGIGKRFHVSKMAAGRGGAGGLAPMLEYLSKLGCWNCV